MNGPLLSAEEELKYGMIVQKCMRLQNREEELEKEIGREPSVEECARDMKMSRRYLRFEWTISCWSI